MNGSRIPTTECGTPTLPPVSVILPTYNGARRLPTILRSLRNQDLNQSLVEILVVDDDSTDGTAEVSRGFGARVVRNGARDPERGKAIGIRAASHDIVMFVDDDHELPHTGWLRAALSAFLAVPGAVAAEPTRFQYMRGDSATNRYVSMFGANDPVAFYLRRRDRLMITEHDWQLAGAVVTQTPGYWVVEFSARNLPPVGAQGFITRKSLIQRTQWWPLYFHIDSNLQLVRQGKNRFVMLKSSIIHHHSDTIAEFLSKLRRNMNQYLHVRTLRSYGWTRSRLAIAAAGVKMLTLAIPLVDGVKCFLKTRDTAAFLHPYFSFVVPLMYAGQIIAHAARGEAAAEALRRRLLAENRSGDAPLHLGG